MRDDAAFSDPQRERMIFVGRLFIGSLAILILTIVLLLRYFDLQVSRHEDFATQSNKNRVLVRPVAPPRGLIYDRNGLLLADNRPSYDLTIVPERSENIDSLIGALDNLISVSESDIQRFEKS